MERRWPNTVDDSVRKREYGPRLGARIYEEDETAYKHMRYSRSRAQARFRGEEWALTYEEWLQCWGDKITRSGTGSHDYCLARLDTDKSWNPDNVRAMTRNEANQRSKRARHRELNDE